MKCQQWDKIFLQDIVTNVAPRIVRGTTSGHNYGPGQVILEESNFCVFTTGDLISNACDTTVIFSTWSKNTTLYQYDGHLSSHIALISKQKTCFDFDFQGRLPQY